MTTSPDILPNEKVQDYTKRYIKAIYEDLSGYISYVDGEKEEAAKDKVFLTYGEIDLESIANIIDMLPTTKDDIFYDFGSGIGKVNLQFFMATPVKKVHGIEASEKRHANALKAREIIKQDLPELFASGRDMDFTCGNFLKTPIKDATLIFICATCFSEELMLDIGNRVNEQCPDIRFIVSLKPIPNSKLPLMGILKIECSWDKTKCYVYGHGKAEDFEGIEPPVPESKLESETKKQ